MVFTYVVGIVEQIRLKASATNSTIQPIFGFICLSMMQKVFLAALPDSSLPTLEVVTHCHFRIWTQTVTFET